MKRALVAVAVVAVVIVVYLMTRTHERTDETASTTGSSASSGATASSTSTTDHRPTVTPAPSLPANNGETRLPAQQPVDEYEVGGVQVRDHRAGSNARLDVPPNVHPPGAREIPSKLTQAVAQQVRGVLAQCTKDIPRETRGPHPRLEGLLIVTIKDHTMTVTDATMKLRDMPADSLDATQQCVEQHSVGLTADAPDQQDLDKYSIGVTFAVL
jgi:hypothetical protein